MIAIHVVNDTAKNRILVKDLDFEVPEGVIIADQAGVNIGDIWDGFEWVVPLPAPAEALAAERAGMVCSRLQGRLVLGEKTCAAIDAMAADDRTPWAMRQTILNAIEWRRTSQAVTELGYMLGYTDTQMDDLFRVAMTVDV